MTVACLLWILAVTVIVAVSVCDYWYALRALVSGHKTIKTSAQHVDVIACIC
jgi:hypothetical protein